MKHFIILFLIFPFLATEASAQLVAKINPGGLLLGTGSASLEGFLSNRISAQLDGYLTPGATKSGIDFSGAGLGLSARFYATTSERPTGLFLSPFVAQHWVSFNDVRAIEHRYNFTALGGQVGYQLEFNRMLSVELGGGIWTGLNVPTFKQAFGVNEYYGEGLNFWLNIGVGIVLWSK